jgi:aminopeptidase N
MLLLHTLALAAAIQAQSDPNTLKIGRGGTVHVAPGSLVDTRRGKVATLDDFLAATDRSQFVYLGESHATTALQVMEATIIRALAARGRRVIVGVEMYQRPKQDVLDEWSAQKLSEPDFLSKSEWETQWGFDYSFYRPVFDAVRELSLPLVALNVPHDWVHFVAQKGYAGLPTSAKLQLPKELFLGNKDHRTVFDSMMGGHSMGGTNMDNLYSAQVLWDEGMADTALKYLERAQSSASTVFVILAGAGHVMYEQGINYRVARRHGGSGTTLVMIQSDSPLDVSRGIGNFLLVTASAGDSKQK